MTLGVVDDVLGGIFCVVVGSIDRCSGNETGMVKTLLVVDRAPVKENCKKGSTDEYFVG